MTGICLFCGKEMVVGGDHHKHHVVPRSNGGNKTIYIHAECHRTIHSKNGDFREWGKKGGLVTASRRHYIRNLRQYKRRTEVGGNGN